MNLLFSSKFPSSTRLLVFSLLLVLPLLLAGCGLIAFSPEAAVVSEIQNTASHTGNLVPDTLEVVQKAKFDDQTFVMARFQQDHKDLGRMQCLFLYEARKSPVGGWMAGGGGGGCSSGPMPEQVISVGANISSGDFGQRKLGFTTVYGEVFNPKVTSVQVAWDDGTEQEVEVVNAAYLAARSGASKHTRIQALAEDGSVLYSEENPAPAPGKEEK